MSVDVERKRCSALLKANRVRLANGQTFRRIEGLPFGSSRLMAASVLRAPTEDQLSMRLWQLLGSVRSLGPSKIDRLLIRADIRADPKRRLRELTQRQRDVIAYDLERHR